jgi:hypothetical protein
MAGGKLSVREGYKIVTDTGLSVYGIRVQYVVGQSYRLPEGARVEMCQTGYHYCPVAVDCLRYVPWDDTHRLLKVEALGDADVVTDKGINCASSGIIVLADVTRDVADLLTGVVRVRVGPNVDVSVCRGGFLHADDGPANVYRNITHGLTTKKWAPAGYGWVYSKVWRLGQEIFVTTNGANRRISRNPDDDDEYHMLNALLDRIEDCERVC